MQVRFVNVSNRFNFEHANLSQDKAFKLQTSRNWKGFFGRITAEAKVQLDHGGVVIGPSKGQVFINDQPVQVGTKLKHGDTVLLRADDDAAVEWQYQEDLVAAKRARQEKERAKGIVRPSLELLGEQSVKYLGKEIRINEQGVDVKSFFRWKQLPWDQLGWIGYHRAYADNIVTATYQDVRYKSFKAVNPSEFITLFDRGCYTIWFWSSDKACVHMLQNVSAVGCVVLCELLEYFAPFDLLCSE